MPRNQVTGSLPSSLPPQLAILDFNYNNLTGSLPAAWGQNNGTLQEIILYDNQLTGSLPASWTFPYLSLLTLLSNKLTGTIPAAWGLPDAMPMLQELYVGQNSLTGTLPILPAQLQELITGDNQLTGTLPRSGWPAQLQFAEMSINKHNGSIPAELMSMTQLQALELTENRLTGQLPEAWGAPGAFPDLFALECADNLLSGTLYSSWGSSSAFQQLQLMDLSGNDFTGVLPDSWGSSGAFPALKSLTLEDTAVTGTIPASWSSQAGFAQLQAVSLDQTYLTGPVPAFNNTNLAFVSLSQCNFTSDLSGFWSSTAPLSVVSLTNNSLSGSLPEDPLALTSLQFLDVSANKLHGTVPLSWLEAGNLLSHVSYLDVGRVWHRSLSMSSWRQQLCLHPNFYSPDVTGLQLAHLPDMLQGLLGQEIGTTTDTGTWEKGSVQSDDAQFFVSILQQGHNQLTGVPEICSNSAAGKVLLILWLLFGACCLAILGLYAFLHVRPDRSKHLLNANCLHLLPVRLVTVLMQQTFSGLGGLVFYYYDLITSIIVLTQIWNTWPGYILAAIFFFHFAVVGFIVSVQALFRLVAWKCAPSKHAFSLNLLIILCSMFGGPVLIPLVILLDTVAFFRKVILCLQQIANLPGFGWLQPLYVAVFRVHHCVGSQNLLGLSWVDLENYESMHNLIAAVLQSLPTVVLNSILFSLGNKPSHGIFLSNTLFVAAIIASCLAMLKCLAVVLFQADKDKMHPVKHIVRQIFGKTLAIEPQVLQSVSSSSIELLIRQYELSGSVPLGSAHPGESEPHM